MNFIKNSAHWYDKAGKPVYEVQNKSKPGAMRPTTISDARKMDLLPSVTTLDSQTHYYAGLDFYKQKWLLLSALTHPNNGKLPVDDLVDLVISEAQRDGEEAANLGSLIHEIIDCYYKNDGSIYKHLRDKNWEIFVERFSAFSNKHKLVTSSTEFTIVEPILGYAGKVDWIGEIEGVPYLIDFKSMRTKGKEPTPYKKWIKQLAAYAAAVNNNLLTANVIISSDTGDGINFGDLWIVKYSRQQQEAAFGAFRNTLEHWCWDKEYYPGEIWNDRKCTVDP